ncbi:hypothetical protein Cni_G01622 [Canna indica]|uniref:Lil3 protein n=1 Tax=Canna indica TaxID=4628 RepID=A0AAQ3JQZ2_9LILI|nr:hypothetical protein Cni_G01622 [Canna indica]
MALSSFPAPPTFFSALSSNHHRLPSSVKPQFHPLALPKRNLSLFLARSTDRLAAATTVDETLEKKGDPPPLELEEKKPQQHRHHHQVVLDSDGGSAAEARVVQFKDPRWVGGTWDLKQFSKDGKTDWDAVIHAEARRRKWLEDYPEASSNDEPVLFDTSIIPWWAWIKSFHLPEAEKLNGRAAMIGFFMAYFVDSLTGMGLVDQMGNVFCKTLLFLAVMWVLLIRENKDIEKLKNLFEETTLYDKQWQATWQEDASKDSNK